MDLWIRSQDREILTKIDYVYLETSNGKEILGGNHYMINKHLGTYKTKERALEVLDEIQNSIIKGSFSEIRNGLNELVNITPNPVYVYQMPID